MNQLEGHPAQRVALIAGQPDHLALPSSRLKGFAKALERATNSLPALSAGESTKHQANFGMRWQSEAATAPWIQTIVEPKPQVCFPNVPSAVVASLCRRTPN
ncbi:MAG: hypothetical protein ACT4OT_02885 [Acidobacteriota bacterium]